MVFKLCVLKCFQMMCFKVFSNDVFQTVFKNLPQVSMVFKLYVFKMCFKVFSNCVFQSVFKIPHRFQSVFKLCTFKMCFQMMCFKVFSKISSRFQWFSNYVFQSIFKLCVSNCFQKSPIGFNGFQIVCFQNMFQSVFKNLP